MSANDNFNIDWDELNKLSPEERKVALEILQQYATEGKSDIYETLKNSDWDEIPVDIHTFMHDRRYLGNALYDAEGRFTIFPYWEKCLEDIFPSNTTTKYNTIVFTGAIGLGKSTIAVICQLYMLYRLLCLKDPYQYYGMQSIDKLSISLMNITLENARGVALDKLNQMILASEWFLSHGEMRGTTNLKYYPEKHIELITASSNNQIIGRALFCNFTDEVNFALVQDPDKQKKRMMKMITQIDARMKSRFMRGTYLPTLNIIASSKDSEQSFLEAYIKNKRDNESKNTLIVDEPQWVVDSRKDTPEKFWVAVGSSTLANELPIHLTDEELREYKERGYDMWQVPIGYLDTFQLNLDEAICSIIGIATASTLRYISGAKLMNAKSNEYENPFIKDVIEVGTEDTLQYSHFFDLTKLNPEDMERPLFIHLDMSSSKDKTGIAGVWITGKEVTNASMTLPEETDNPNGTELLNTQNSIEAASLSYKLAFSVSIKAPKDGQIAFAKHEVFINWLREQGFDIKKISADTFQSTTTLQALNTDGFETEIVSVDRLAVVNHKTKVCLPYHYLRAAIYERRIKIYQQCELLTKELLELERESDGRINHPDDGKHGSKDQADAVCGALFLASKYATTYAQEYGEQISNSVEVSSEAVMTPKQVRKQMVTNFEEELNKIYLNKLKQDTKRDMEEFHSKDEIDDYNIMKDIYDGILSF